MENLSKDLEIRLLNTPVSTETIIKELRSKELTWNKYVNDQRFDKNVIERSRDLCAVVEGFLRVSSMAEITSVDDVRNLLKQFLEQTENSLSERERCHAKSILVDSIISTKADTFVYELPREEFVRQRDLARKEFDEMNDSFEDEDLSEPSILDEPEMLKLYQTMADEEARNVGATEIDRTDEYSPMEVQMISTKVIMRLHDLFSEFL